jgi:hypothetical protein
VEPRLAGALTAGVSSLPASSSGRTIRAAWTTSTSGPRKTPYQPKTAAPTTYDGIVAPVWKSRPERYGRSTACGSTSRGTSATRNRPTGYTASPGSVRSADTVRSPVSGTYTSLPTTMGTKLASPVTSASAVGIGISTGAGATRL